MIAHSSLDVEVATRNQYHGSPDADMIMRFFGSKGSTGKVTLARVW